MVQIRMKEKAGGIVDLYNLIAEQLGFDHRACTYDCTKIEVSADIEETIRNCYEDQEQFAMSWLVFGPKLNEKLAENTVAIDGEFIKYETPDWAK